MDRFVYLFNSISTLVGLFKAKAILLEMKVYARAYIISFVAYRVLKNFKM